MAEVTLRWPTARSTPINPDWEERTYSCSQAAAEAIVEMGHTVYVGSMRSPVTVADAKRELDLRARRSAEQAELVKAVRSERDRVIEARRQAVAEQLHQSFGVGPFNSSQTWLEAADLVISTYEAVR